ncbi:MAG: AraC family transcriptional regulator [Paludibacter sp.]|jgi:AraC-like DNA-binding protein|nr:AraC family transcriptional regulator [Paludibacter sp.]MDX9919017.1 AraC family transcriptional regulator [Paludibacter sp.]
MQVSNIFREVTPLSAEDCFVIRSRVKSEFNYPVHVHPEFELNYIENAPGAQRLIGDSLEEIGDYELCLIGNENLEHAWMNGSCDSKDIFEITIQFHKDLFFESMLSKRQFHSVAIMFENAKKGIVYSRETILKVRDLLHKLCKNEEGFHSVIDLLNILQTLSEDKNSRILATSTFANRDDSSDSRRIQKVIDYLHENYQKEIHLADVAGHVNMSEVSFSRFMKKRTGKNYIEYLNDLRLGIASRHLIDTTKTVAEISYECGFNNLSNFNRIFKKRKGVTPKEFRESYTKMRILI